MELGIVLLLAMTATSDVEAKANENYFYWSGLHELRRTFARMDPNEYHQGEVKLKLIVVYSYRMKPYK